MNRFITSFDSELLPKTWADVVIIGAGIAGMYTALMLPDHLKIMILSKGSLEEMNSYYAQGGIAAPIDKEYDSPKKHYDDTLVCGRYFNSPEAVSVLVNEAQENIERLIQLGVMFDCDEEGRFELGKEGGHALARVLHIGGDKTGEGMISTLRESIKKRDNIEIIENCFAIDLLTHDNCCYGVLADINNQQVIYQGKCIVMATGGIGHLYNRTTNATGIQGDGIAMAIRAGAKVKDLDLVQFHPTAFYKANQQVEQTFLISEAVRGEGAILRNSKGERFMTNVHPLKELAPRDVVSQAIRKEMNQADVACVYLDITHQSKAFLQRRFPTIYQYCYEQGIQMELDWVPVAPVAHYFMGGIDVDLCGRTSINFLYACGECACTGVHGKNRLASNSLLEAVVFGYRVASDIVETIDAIALNDALKEVYQVPSIAIDRSLDQKIRQYMMDCFGMSIEELDNAKRERLLMDEWDKYSKYSVSSRDEMGIMNKLLLAGSILNRGVEKEGIKVC